MAERKKRSQSISRRDFLVDAGLMASGAAIGSIAFLMSCRATEKTVTQAVTGTVKEPPTPSTSHTSGPSPTPTPTTAVPTPSPDPTTTPSAPLSAARFVLGDLTITPTTVNMGEDVTISIQVSNVGGAEGSYTVVFKCKNTGGGATSSDNVEVTLEPGQTKTATLTTTPKESGTYHVSANDKVGQYTVTSRLATKPFARQTRIEVVTNKAATFNPKGGNQTRIVHTQDGVFTAYIVEHNGDYDHEWRLAKRQSDGIWAVIAQGDAGTFPVNLLASPDGTLHVIGWSNGIGMMWSGKPINETLVMTSSIIPNAVQGNLPYPAAGIDANGNLCVISVNPNKTDPLNLGKSTEAELKWAFYIPSQSQWVTQTYEVDYRYTYSYVFPGPNGQLSLVATRDCSRELLGIAQPPGAAPWIFNAFRYWRTNDVSSETFQVLSFAEEIPTDQYPDPFLTIQDAYLDTKDRMHIIYQKSGATTGGGSQIRHRIVSASGTTLFDEKLLNEAGQYCRIFQDKQERFYLLSSSALLYPMDQEGQSLGDPMKLDLEGHEVIWTGYSLSVPRTGTPLSDVMDVGFVSDNFESWSYFQLDFSGKLPL
jgi:hypothetical protein